jgi:hypothetical protein
MRRRSASQGSAVADQPLHWPHNPGPFRVPGEVAEWLKALAC